MKTKTTLIKFLSVLFFAVIGLEASAQQITANDTVCAGTLDRVYGITSANATSTYTWYLQAASGGSINDSVVANDSEIKIDWGLTPGDYTVYAVETTQWGCIADSVELLVHVNDLPTAVVTSDSVCEGFDPTLTFVLTGEAPWTINFTDGTNNFSTVATSSPHTYTITGMGYTVTQSVDVTGVTDGNTCDEGTNQTGLPVVIHPVAPTGAIYHY